MRQGLSDALWASAVQWARVAIGGIFFLIAARTLPLAEIGAFAIAAAPLRFLQVIHKGGIEDAAVTTLPEDRAALAALHRLSVVAGLAAGFVGLALGLLLDRITPGAGIARMAAALALVSVAHGLAAVPDGMLRRAGQFRALAGRTFAGQTAAAGLGLWALATGAGVWALVIFTLAQAAIAAAVALAMTGWPQGPAGHWRGAAARAAPLAGRVMAGALVQPVLQVAIGSVAGLAMGGVWQVATRLIGMLEALTIVPLRFVALPRLAADGPTARLDAVLTAAGIAGVWVMGGTALAAPTLLSVLLGEAGGPVVAPLRVLCAGAVAGGGIAMLNQAMIGAGRGPEVLRIAVVAALTALAAGGVALALAPSQAATALALSQVAAGLVPLLMLLRAAERPRDILAAMLRPCAAFVLMAPAVWLAAWLATPLPPGGRFAAQVIAGSAALALTLPLLLQGRRT